MFDPTDELARFLDEHGVHGWVTGEMGQQMLLGHWIDWFLGQCKDVFDSDSASAAERLAALRDMLDKSPDRKTISVKRIRESLIPEGCSAWSSLPACIPDDSTHARTDA